MPEFPQTTSFSSDIYSLGVLFHELLTLVHYLDGKDSIDALVEGVLHESPVVPTFLSKRGQCPVPAELNWFVDRCLQKNPMKRYASVDEMLHRLDLRAQGIIPVQCPMTLVKRVTLATGRFSERTPPRIWWTMCSPRRPIGSGCSRSRGRRGGSSPSTGSCSPTCSVNSCAPSFPGSAA